MTRSGLSLLKFFRPFATVAISPVMNAIEAYIHFTPDLVTDDGQVTVPETEEFLRNYMAEFRDFTARVLSVYPRPS